VSTEENITEGSKITTVDSSHKKSTEGSKITTVDSSQSKDKERLEIESFRVNGWQEVELKFSAAMKDLDASAINNTWIHI
jgi:alpha-L-arabinofuranosidase